MNKSEVSLSDGFKKTAMTIVDKNGNSWLWAANWVPRIGEKMKLPLKSGDIVAEIGEVLYDVTTNMVVIVVRGSNHDRTI